MALSLNDKIVLNYVFNPSLPLSECCQEEPTEELQDEEEATVETDNVKQLEIQAVNEAEKRNYENAFNILNEAVKIAPQKASLYNNRAQIYQFVGKPEEALLDLRTAIDLAEEKQKKTLCQALCQRGLLYRKNNQLELAREDFERAANLGSKFARTQLVEINPYAALCNQMLRQVMDELK